MAGETVITIVGNLTADPELRTIGSGATVASFTIASTPRTWNRQTNQFEDGQALFMRCSAWRDLADHCAQSLKKGMRVIATGRLQQRSYQAQDGSQRTVVEMQLDEIGPSLRYATAQVTRQSSGQGGFQGRSGGSRVVSSPIRAMATRGAKVVMPVARAVTTVAIRVVALDTPSSLPLPPTRPLLRSTRGVMPVHLMPVASPRSALPPISAATIPTRSSDQYLPPRCQQQSISRFIRRTSCHVRGRNRRSSRSRRSRTR